MVLVSDQFWLVVKRKWMQLFQAEYQCNIEFVAIQYMLYAFAKTRLCEIATAHFQKSCHREECD